MPDFEKMEDDEMHTRHKVLLTKVAEQDELIKKLKEETAEVEKKNREKVMAEAEEQRKEELKKTGGVDPEWLVGTAADPNKGAKKPAALGQQPTQGSKSRGQKSKGQKSGKKKSGKK
jgi:hypothetical protein